MVWALYREIRLGRTEVRTEVVQPVNAIRAEIGERIDRAHTASRERFEQAETANRERFEQAESANRERHAEVLRALGAFGDEVRTWRVEVTRPSRPR